MIPPLQHPRADWADDRLRRVKPRPQPRRDWSKLAAGALIALAIIVAGGLIGWFAHANAMEQVETCMEGCP